MLRSEATIHVLKQRSPLTKLNKRKCSTYICPVCQCDRTNGLQGAAILPSRSTRRINDGTTTSNSFRPTFKRNFTTSRTSRSPEHALQESTSNGTEYNFTIKPKKSIEKPVTPIRNSLRLWGSQNEVQKQRNTPLDVPAEGRITQLPNALFLKDAGEEPEEDIVLGTDAFADEDIGESGSMEPGTLFSHDGGLHRQYAVYLGHVGVQAQLVLQGGKWSFDRLSNSRSFSSGSKLAVIPNFLSPEEVAEMKECVPNEIIQRSTLNGNEKSDVAMQGLLQGPKATRVLGVYLNKMRKFAFEVEEFNRAYGADIDAAYEKVAHETEWRHIPLNDYARAAGHDYETLNDSGRMALLGRINEVDRLSLDTNARTISILCCSKDLNRRMLKVVDWARQYQDAAVQAALGKDVMKMLRSNPLTSFIDKARRLVLKSRKIRAPTTLGCLGPTSGDKGSLRKIMADEEFTEDDKSIIDFLWNASFRKPRPMANGSWKMVPMTSLILRAVGAYPSLCLEPKVGRLFLKEIGCADPWTGKFSQDMGLPLPGGRASHRADALQEELINVAKQFETDFKAHKGIPPHTDTMAHIRKDWGSLPALAIDPENAEVVEDAISLEPAKEMPGGYWLHVHISHITSCFDVQSIVSRHARHQGSACFMVDGSLPVGMVPRSLTIPFSLQAGAPVLTVSTLITEDGRVHESKVSAGVIRNFERIDRLAIDHVLDIEDTQDDYAVLVVGKVPYVKRPPLSRKAIEKASKHKETLEIIQRLTAARLKRRRTEMSMQVTLESPEYGSGVSTTLVNYRPGPDREHHSYHWHGDPGIILTGKRRFGYQLSDEKRSDDIVTQMMRLAAESAGNWLAEREIPAVFLGTQASPGNPLSNFTKGADVRQTIAPLFHRSSTPLTYWNINMKAYALCTSPLRRYMDMVVCYQMDSYLKAEASGAIQPGAPIEDESLLALSKAEVNSFIDADAGSSDNIDLATRIGKLDYAFQALFRAFHFKESKLPEIWEVLILEPSKYSASGKELFANGKLLPFGLDVKVRSCPQNWDKVAGYHQFLPVKIELVDPDQLIVWVIPAGPPTKNQMLLDPIQAWSEDNLLEASMKSEEKMTIPRQL